jgi:hypothetical protein
MIFASISGPSFTISHVHVFFSPVMTERWRELLAQLSHELDLQAARLKDLELQHRQLLDP